MISAELKEQLLVAYTKTYDRDLVYKKFGLTEEEQKALNGDDSFQQRMAYYKAEGKELIIEKLHTLMMCAEKDDVKLKAAIKLGELIYPETFSSENKPTELILPLETQKRMKDAFSGGVIDAWKTRIIEKLLAVDEDASKLVHEITGNEH